MKNFFMENEKLSMGRLLSFVTCLTGLAIGVIAVLKGNANASIVSISISFVGVGIGGKVISKIKEPKL